MAENLTGVAGVVLAGGASSRMGRPKALMPFLGRPLAARALDRLRPQVAEIYLNVRAAGADYAALGAALVVDSPRHLGAGPLAGVAAALARAREEGFGWLASAPCDAPFAPRDLVARLAAAGAPAAVARTARGWEPMFALWPVSALAAVEAALGAGDAGPRDVLRALGAAEIEFDAGDFANLNTPEAFAAAEAAADLLEAREPAPAGPKGVVS